MGANLSALVLTRLDIEIREKEKTENLLLIRSISLRYVIKVGHPIEKTSSSLTLSSLG